MAVERASGLKDQSAVLANRVLVLGLVVVLVQQVRAPAGQDLGTLQRSPGFQLPSLSVRTIMSMKAAVTQQSLKLEKWFSLDGLRCH